MSVPSAVSRSGGALPNNSRYYSVVGSRCASTAAQFVHYGNDHQAVSNSYSGPGVFSQDVPGACIPAHGGIPLGNAQKVFQNAEDSGLQDEGIKETCRPQNCL